MDHKKTLGRAAKNAITRHIIDLTAVIEANLETVILACEKENLITWGFKGNRLDGLTGQSARDRAQELVVKIQNTVNFFQSSLDTFLFVLVDTAEESAVIDQLAANIAASCKCHLCCAIVH